MVNSNTFNAEINQVCVSDYTVKPKDIAFGIDFDSASLDIDRTRVEGDHVVLAGLENHNPGYWKWIYFRMDGVAGQELMFELGSNFESGSERLENHRMVYSYDNTEWDFFPYGEQLADGRYLFGLQAPFENDRVFIAYGLPYPYSRLESFVDSIRDSDFVGPTRSSRRFSPWVRICRGR